MAALEGLDDDHVPAAARAWRVGIGRFDGRLIDGRRCDREQLAGAFETGLASASGEEAIVADAVEPARQGVEKKAADELGRGQAHDLLAIPILDAVILPAKGDSVSISADQAAVRDGDAVGIAAQVGKHGLWATKGRFGIDDPFGFAE